MTYISRSDGPAYIRLFQGLALSESYTHLYPSEPITRYAGDFLMMDSTSFRIVTVSDELRISSHLGLTNHELESRADRSSGIFLTERPTNFPLIPREDDWKYGSIANFGAFFSNVPTSEKQVSHTRFVGDVRDARTDDLDRFNTSILSDGSLSFTSKSVSGATHGVQSTGVNSQGYLTFAITPGSGSDVYDSLLFDGREYFSMIKQYLANVGSGPVIMRDIRGDHTLSYRDITSDITREGNIEMYSISYTYSLSSLSRREYATFEVHLNFSIAWRESYGTRLAFDNNPFSNDICQIENHSSVTCSSGGVRSLDDGSYIRDLIDGGLNPPYVYQSSRPYPFSEIGQTGGANSGFSGYRKFDSDTIMRRHRLFADQVSTYVLPHVRPASFLASADAMKSYTGVLKQNNLQTLQHAKDLLGMLPDLPGFFNLVAKALRGDPSVLKDLVDYLTEAVLRWSFQQRPTKDLAVELLDPNLKNKLEQVISSHSATIYGSFSWDFPDKDNFMGDGRMTLSVHSKVRITRDLSTVMSALLLGNSVGLLPTLSRLWQLLPFSFVIDWFTNMAKRIELVDIETQYLLMRTEYCVHSYTVTYYPSDEELSRYSLENVSPDRPFGISVYTREVSRYMPRLGESKYDFLSPTHRPDSLTVGSLIYQLLS